MQSQKRMHTMRLSDGDGTSRFAEASTSTQYVTFIVHRSVTEFNTLLPSVRLVVQLLLSHIWSEKKMERRIRGVNLR